MSISTADIKLLRESTGAGILDCKKALQETDGNIDEAIELLRKKGLSAAAKKASREAKEGEVNAQVLEEGKHTGALPGRVVRGPGWTGWSDATDSD